MDPYIQPILNKLLANRMLVDENIDQMIVNDALDLEMLKTRDEVGRIVGMGPRLLEKLNCKIRISTNELQKMWMSSFKSEDLSYFVKLLERTICDIFIYSKVFEGRIVSGRNFWIEEIKKCRQTCYDLVEGLNNNILSMKNECYHLLNKTLPFL